MEFATTAPAPVPASVQKIADYYRADIEALGATKVAARPAGIIVFADDAARATTLASLLSPAPHGIRLLVTSGSTQAHPAALTPNAIADAIHGAGLHGVAGVSWSDGGTHLGRRISPVVSVHVDTARRKLELNHLLTSRVVGPNHKNLRDGIPLLIVESPLPMPGGAFQVRPADRA